MVDFHVHVVHHSQVIMDDVDLAKSLLVADKTTMKDDFGEPLVPEKSKSIRLRACSKNE